MARMKGITVHQPWAWAIIAGHKTIENRSWTTPHRGRIAIHAGVSRDSEQTALARLVRAGLRVPDPDLWPRGAVIGTVELVDIVPIDALDAERRRSPFADGPYCWLLERPRALRKPVEVRGAQGIFDVDF